MSSKTEMRTTSVGAASITHVPPPLAVHAWSFEICKMMDKSIKKKTATGRPARTLPRLRKDRIRLAKNPVFWNRLLRHLKKSSKMG